MLPEARAYDNRRSEITALKQFRWHYPDWLRCFRSSSVPKNIGRSESPPSTTNSVPVIYAASDGDKRNAAAAPQRPDVRRQPVRIDTLPDDLARGTPRMTASGRSTRRETTT